MIIFIIGFILGFATDCFLREKLLAWLSRLGK
jgi:hypothetical protein